MNPPESKTTRYAVAGVCGLLLLVLLGWFVLREPPAATDDQRVKAATAPPRVRHVAPRFTPEDDTARETTTNQVTESQVTNAAVLYRQAFALYDALSKEQKGIVSNWRTNLDASVEAELCGKTQPICELLHQAAAVRNCDWGVEQPITFETLLPHLNPCRNLARTAVWSVAHCRTGDPAAAIEDFVAASRLGQNASSPPTGVGHTVDLAIQGIVIDSVAEHASILVSAGDTRVVELLKDANYDEGVRRAFEQESDSTSRLADRLAMMPSEEAMRMLESITDQPDDLRSRLRSIELMQVVADIRQAAELQREYTKALELSEAEYGDWLARLQVAQKTNPFVAYFVTGLGAVVDKTRAMTVRSAMAAAGLVVMQDGPDALQSHLDPATGQPFGYSQSADGFELQSSFELNGVPLKLRFK